MNEGIRILLVDDHVIVRSGLTAYIETEPDLEIAAEAGSLEEARRRIADSGRIDIAVVDLRLPDGSGVEFIRELADGHPEVRTLTLSVNAGERDVLAAVEAGTGGYLSKSAERGELIDAIRQIAAGGGYFPASIRRKLEQGHVRPRLTGREAAIMEGIVGGLSNKEIADKLGIADATARQHVSAILRKFGAADRTQLAVLALREGYVRADEAGGV
ncbi:MAG: response regulator [Opitutales bacterium]